MNIWLKIFGITIGVYILIQVAASPKVMTDFDEATSLVQIKQINKNIQSTKISQNNTNIKNTQSNKSYPNEKRATPAYDTITGEDGLPHYRVLFWVPKDAKKFIPYADEGVVTDVSSHGPVGKWSIQETKIDNKNEKLVFIFVPKTFVFLYGIGFEKVIHLKCS